jgi:hypothetical protein
VPERRHVPLRVVTYQLTTNDNKFAPVVVSVDLNTRYIRSLSSICFYPNNLSLMIMEPKKEIFCSVCQKYRVADDFTAGQIEENLLSLY